MSALSWCPRCATALVSGEHSGKTRLLCPKEGCGWVFYDNPLPVVAGVVETPAGVVLVRNAGWPASWFGLVTGFLERDETPEQGILREIKEEIGLDAEMVGFIGVYSFTMRNELILAYHLRASGEIVLGPEIEAFKVVPVEKLRPWPMGTGEAVRDFLARRATP
ncbi:MAG: NUDIX domain-containing protein [Myxococcota bacterium]